MVGFLYGQTEYSILENAIHLDDYVNHGVLNAFPFLTITDSNMHGHLKFYNACKKNNIKPIIGLRVKINSKVNRLNAVLLYAKNKTGYQNLLRISTEQELNNIVSDEFIKANNEGLILVTSAVESDLDYFVYMEDSISVRDELNRLRSLCKDIYIGVMPSSFLYDTICEEIISITEAEGLKLLPIAKSSYLTKDDELVYLSLLKISETNAHLGLDDLHLKSKEELEEEFSEISFVFDNLNEFVEKIESDIITLTNPLPKFPNKLGISSKDYLQGLCKKGLEKRLLNTGKDISSYQERLNFELSIIDKMGYNDYFLIVWDFIKFAKNSKILVGPGRGSAPGSLVAYTLGITEIDPIEYGLLFERFLNPERVSNPDIDVDIPDDKRDLVINYVKEKYGQEHVCYITAFGTFQLKSSVRDLFRVYGYDQKYIESIIRLLERKATEEEIKNEFESHPELLELIHIAKKIEGLPRHISTHAAGIILSDKSLLDLIPLRSGINNMYQSQLEASDLEQIGLLKIDFLGIRNLSIISDVVTEIQKVDKTFDIRKIDLNDKKTFELLQEGDTLGIFQLESTGITNVIKKMKPTQFEDLVAVLALYRPGPMDNINEFIARKHGQEFEYIHPKLEPILSNTYGFIVYQEQIMRVAQVFAGYSLGEADVLRRAVSKKKKEVLEAERNKFITSSVNNGFNEEEANQIYDYIEKFADYGFNRSHSVAYGVFAYQMAYLKANYPKIFIAKLLNNVIGNDSELAHYIKYATSKGIKVLGPDLNLSTNKFVLVDDKLVMPINSVHSIGSVVAKKIVAERTNGKFNDFFEFKKRMSSEVNSRMLENLINAGFFDSLGYSHAYLLNQANNDFAGYINKDESVDNMNELSELQLKENELQALGFNLKYDVFQKYNNYKIQYKASDVNELVVDKKVNMVGVIKRIKTLKTKKGDMMAFITLDCNNKFVDVVAFTETYTEYQGVLEYKGLVLINGVVRTRNDELQVQLNKIKILE